MNKRLSDQYNSIYISSKDKFLNNQIEIDRMWGKSIYGITFQIELSADVKDKLCNIQNDLTKINPDDLLLLPKEFQHISFNQVVFWGGEYTKGLENTWHDLENEFIVNLNKLNNKYASFGISFSKLIATTGGIIWCASDKNDEMEKLRDSFFKDLPFPPETTKFNHIIHTTVARYKSELSNTLKVFEYIENCKTEAHMKVDKIVLKNELVFPSLKTIDLGTINLI